MSDDDIKTMEDMEFNEILFISKSGGRLQSWRGWKRAMAAFADPAMWEDPAEWSKYFEPLQGNTWGPVCKGVVLVDFDEREALSLSDWSTPESLTPHNPHTLWPDGEDPDLAPLRALAARPDQWSRVEIEFRPVGLLRGMGETKTLTVDQLLPGDAGAEDFMNLLTVDRMGMLKLGKHGRGIGHCRYLPDGWVQHDDRGKEMPAWIIERLEALRDAGWPAPDWEAMDSHLEHGELPLDDQQIDEMLREEGEQDWVMGLEGLARRYIALKQSWGSGVAPTRMPGP